MRNVGKTSLAFGLTAAVVVAWFGFANISGQSDKSYSVPRTAWGDPDLQGTWTNFDDTPFQTPNPDPAALAAEQLARKMRSYGGVGGERPNNPYGGVDNHTGKVSAKRRSMVVDPPNGRITVVAGLKTYLDDDRELMRDHYKYHPPQSRCITRGVPSGMFSSDYNNARQIVQAPGYVAIYSEMIHDTRIIPVDGSPHIPEDIRLWNGDSRGRWDGTTLVVETTNYNDKGLLVMQTPLYQTRATRITERFNRVSADTIQYSVTFEDPNLFTRPWTAALPYNREDDYRIYEYACHEGNRNFMENTLKGGRFRDAEEARKGR